MTSPYAGLNDADREALRKTSRDLGDIDQRTRDRITAGFSQAYATARGISDGRLDPLTH
ncbi:Uncharacterised protein [Mycobacteroides abscessus subsp. abscessus]|uniref:hypothetical protein n=1 Tax=Mycobacteroides abscessus TaxID=36809 RepID=UPI00092892C5|nr:hypothetical protein [Mycobacteroides abscessus]SHU27104.1 Uncharacterised protein [Mycobacteroides abscessus subsp. abscessus]